MRTIWICCLAAWACNWATAGEPEAHKDDLQEAELGPLSERFMVLGGTWTVAAEGENKFLELAPHPLESHSVLFGPTFSAGGCVTGRIQSTQKGRRSYPSFGLGLGGVTGYMLRFSPAKGKVELLLDQQPLAEADSPGWKSGSWIRLKFQVRKGEGGAWMLEGKAWADGQAEPEGWTVSHTSKEAPPAGRAALWGMPYAGTPIRFDDLDVRAP